MESALDVQVGGNHYKGFAYQPVQFSVDMCLNFIQGNIVKYVSRYQYKNGLEDLQKVLHYAQLGLELDPMNFVPFSKVREQVALFTQKNNLTEEVRDIVEAACFQNWLKITVGIKKICELK